MNMKLRRWEEKDIETIAKMEQRCFRDPWTKQMLLDSLRLPIYHCFLVEDEGQVCGYATMIVLFEDAQIGNIAVDIPFRGRGISKLLMEELHTTAKSLGAEQMLLEVRVSNDAALGLYEKYGYEKYGIRAKYYADGEDAFVMRKTL